MWETWGLHSPLLSPRPHRLTKPQTLSAVSFEKEGQDVDETVHRGQKKDYALPPGPSQILKEFWRSGKQKGEGGVVAFTIHTSI